MSRLQRLTAGAGRETRHEGGRGQETHGDEEQGMHFERFGGLGVKKPKVK